MVEARANFEKSESTRKEGEARAMRQYKSSEKSIWERALIDVLDIEKQFEQSEHIRRKEAIQLHGADSKVLNLFN